MDAALRVIHVVIGIFWAGTTFFAAFILIPQLKKLGPAIFNQTVKALMRVVSPVMTVSGLLVLGTGITVILRRGAPISTLLSTGWGVSMLIAFIAIVISTFVIGFGVLTPTGMRLEKLGNSVGERQPTADEDEMMRRLTRRIETAQRAETGLIIVATLIMPLSRFL